MAKAQSWRSVKAHVPLTGAEYRALLCTAQGEVYRTYSSVLYTLTGPCPSQPLWALARAKLIADPPAANQYGRHQMVLTAKGRAALKLRVERNYVTVHSIRQDASFGAGKLKSDV
jgi:hypothetical protein